ncbi:MAG TPA: HAD-IA family hydrolase [Candidatus Babeliales bacterium]|jgi:putative hydrolase of the HAD superfamily|nr:HAD-IA family hydrolase [Candidatus Babeliales bacterium]
MKLYHSIIILYLFIITNSIAAKKITAPDNSQKQIIIFDLTNIVIKENQIGFAKKIGYGTLASYAITHWKNPGYRCLDMLHEMSNHEDHKPHIILTLQKRTLPRCLVELQEGKKTCAQAREEIAQGMQKLDEQKFFSSVKEKELMKDIMDLVLDPQTVTTMIEPVKSTTQLINRLKEAGHPIYCCANAPKELYAASEKKFNHILQNFDGIVISSHIKEIKPGEAILQHLMETYNLNPHNCIVIEDQEEAAATAKKLGMQAIVCDKPSHLPNKLKKCGVRI